MEGLKGEKYGRWRRGPEVSISLLAYMAYVEGLSRVKGMSLEEVEEWCKEHKSR